MKKTAVILSISSDIGFEIGKRMLEDGYRVIGTYRKYGRLSQLAKHENCRLLYCDASDKKSIPDFAAKFKKLNLKWDIFISCIGDLLPAEAFLRANFEEWIASVHLNSLNQLKILHTLAPFRNKSAKVIFFAGGGVNNAVVDLSAYTIAKIILVKMCEFLDAEDGSTSYFTVGPGFVKTKIHDAVSSTKYFFRTKKGITMDDLYGKLIWLLQQPKSIVGGRNFSLKDDPFKKEGLVSELSKDKDMYKLRRHKNIFLRD